jgi:hypothetical protein
MRVQNCDPRTAVQEPFRVAYVTDEESSSARPARRTSLFGNPTFGGPAGDQKSPLRRCFKPRPLVENECKPVASDRRSGCGVFKTPAAVRPLVRMPTDRHAATGTCELGEDYLRNCAARFKASLVQAGSFLAILSGRAIENGKRALGGRGRAPPCEPAAMGRQGAAMARPNGCFAPAIADKDGARAQVLFSLSLESIRSYEPG